MKKNMLAVILTASMLATVVTGYFGSRKMADSEVNAAEGEDYETSETKKNYYVIGVSQFSQDPNMDICREAFVKELEKYDFIEGDNLSIRYLNAQSSESKASQISDSFVADGVDLIYAIESGSAQTSYNSSRGTKVPVVFTASGDPFYVETEEDIDVAEDTADEEIQDNSGPAAPYNGKLAGVVQSTDVEGEVELIKNTLPRLRRLGILYSASDEELIPVIDAYKKVAADNGMLLYCQAVNTASDIEDATVELTSKVDCICVLNDAMITENLETVVTKASELKVPVFGSTKEQVEKGCSAAVSVDYEKLGQTTADLVADILLGNKDITEISTVDFNDSITYANN